MPKHKSLITVIRETVQNEVRSAVQGLLGGFGGQPKAKATNGRRKRRRGTWSPGLAQHLTRRPFGDPEQLANPLHCSAPPRRAQKFPLAASRRIATSSAWSATSFFSRAFSRSSSLSRRA